MAQDRGDETRPGGQAPEDIGVDRPLPATIQDIIAVRLDRRELPFQTQPPVADALYAADTAGPGRAVTRRFFAGPRGAEICGPALTPDGRTLFVAVQHPGEERGSTFDQPTTRWPDFTPGVPPRPAIVVITKQDGGEIGA